MNSKKRHFLNLKKKIPGDKRLTGKRNKSNSEESAFSLKDVCVEVETRTFSRSSADF